MTNALQNVTVGNLSNFTYVMWYLMTSRPFNVPIQSTVREVHYLSGDTANLPCESSVSEEAGKVTLVLWYKGETKVPFYVLDARKSAIEKAKHFCSSGCDSRFHFDIFSQPPSLRIDKATPDDDGVYSCRTEFKMSQTVSSKVRLYIIVPPAKVVIKDAYGNIVEGSIGPYKVGMSLILRCEAIGGFPTPLVTWWHGTVLQEAEIFSTIEKKAIRQLVIPNLQRAHIGNTYTCHAGNSNLTLPVTASVIITMNLKPLHVRIASFPQPLLAGTSVRLSCQTTGARPKAFLSWWLDDKEIQFSSQSQSTNITQSSLVFFPTSQHHNRNLSYRAENPLIPESTIQHALKLNISYPPEMSLALGSSIAAANVREGTDVFMDCRVKANPRVREVWWSFEGHPLYSNATAGVITSNHSLALQSVKTEHRGNYRCTAYNPVGKGESNSVFLRIQHAPVCKNLIREAILHWDGDAVNVTCRLSADPSDVIFKWSLQSNGHLVNLEHFSVNKTVSVLNVRPKEQNLTSGVLQCTGRNDVGLQKVPCVFEISIKNRMPLFNCSVQMNESNSSYLIECGHDENIPNQKFHLDVFDATTRQLLRNISVETLPQFLVQDLGRPQLLFIMYMSSASGSSDPISLKFNSSTGSNLSDSVQKTFHKNQNARSNPSTMLVIWCALPLLIITVIGVLLTIRKMRKQNQLKAGTTQRKKENELFPPNHDIEDENEVSPVDTKRGETIYMQIRAKDNDFLLSRKNPNLDTRPCLIDESNETKV